MGYRTTYKGYDVHCDTIYELSQLLGAKAEASIIVAAKPINTVDGTDKPKWDGVSALDHSAPPTPTCEPWCGTPDHEYRKRTGTPTLLYCTPACRDAGRSLHPRESR